MKVLIGAVKGTGKTTTMRFLTEKDPEVKVFNYGNYMEKLAKEKHNLTRDEIDEGLSNDKHKELQIESAKRMAEDMKGVKKAIIDTHICLIKTTGYYPGIPEFVVKELKPDVIAVLDFDPERIMKNRTKDLGLKEEVRDEKGNVIHAPRKRRMGSIEEIEEQQDMNRYIASAAAVSIGCTVKIISERGIEKLKFENAMKAASRLAELFE